MLSPGLRGNLGGGSCQSADIISGVEKAGGETGADVATGAGNQDQAVLLCVHGVFLSRFPPPVLCQQQLITTPIPP